MMMFFSIIGMLVFYFVAGVLVARGVYMLCESKNDEAVPFVLISFLFWPFVIVIGLAILIIGLALQIAMGNNWEQ